MSKPLQIVIQYGEEGFKMAAPVDKPILCLGMLEFAKAKLVEGLREEERPVIHAPHGINPEALRAR